MKDMTTKDTTMRLKNTPTITKGIVTNHMTTTTKVITTIMRATTTKAIITIMKAMTIHTKVIIMMLTNMKPRRKHTTTMLMHTKVTTMTTDMLMV